MSAAISDAPISVGPQIHSAAIRNALIEDDSPFGLQGLTRDTLRILKPDCISQLAAALAVSARPEQIQDDQYVAAILAARADWQEEYQVVHLIEKSLWIDGHCDLVMTLIRDPSQIPDNPPPRVMQALTLANRLHPRSTIWYGTPLFSDQMNHEGLPIPLTAAEIREEAQRRIAAARANAFRWRSYYRAIDRLRQIPYAAWRMNRAAWRMIEKTAQNIRQYWKRARRDARNRERARILAQSEYCRKGQSFTRIPDHTTTLGLFTEHVGMSIRQSSQLLIGRADALEDMGPVIAGVSPVVFHTLTIATTIAPMIFSPLPIIVCDPFLFVELPDEPGKLRHLGHWYWQDVCGGKKLHLHV